jgi:hypothetical protein
MTVFISDVINTVEFNNRVTVKSYIRKGKVVKSFDRKNNRIKKAITTTGLGVATVLGVSAATYGGLKFRYLSRLNNFAKTLKTTEVLAPTTKKHLTFTIGGFGIAGKPTTNPDTQSKVIAAVIKTLNKDQDVIPLAHSLEVPRIPSNPREHGLLLMSKLFEPVKAGKNTESEKIIQQVYNHAAANPGKTINLATFSAGGNIGRDVQYVLNKKGIKTKLITTGTADFRFVPGSSDLNINSKHDLTNILRSSNTTLVNDVKEHRPDQFYRNKTVKEKIKSYFYSDE